MRAAIYARYSSENQREASIEDQVRLCLDRLTREGWQLAGTYSDRGISGASPLRPGYQKMLEDARASRFEVVISEGLDRLSRDQEHVAALYKQLSFLGIRIVTVAEGEVSDLHVGLKGTMNALYLKDLAQKTRRGLEGRVRLGRSGGGLCYGYEVVEGPGADGEAERGGRRINEREAEVVRRIFRDYAAGKSPRAIAKRLNAEGVPGPRGKAWGPSTINGNVRRGTGILNNELYVGRLVWNRQRFQKDPMTGKRVARLNPEKDWVVQEVPELRIVPQDLWHRVKARQRGMKEAGRFAGTARRGVWDRRRPRYLLSGLVKCGVCGGGYSKISGNLFGCSTARNKGTCANRLNIRRDVLEGSVLNGLKTRLMDPELFKEFADEFFREVNRLRMAEHRKYDEARADLAATDRRIRKIVDAIAEGVPARTLKDELLALEARQDMLRAFLAEERPMQPLLHPNMASLYRQKVAKLQETLECPETRYEAIELLRSLVDEIVLIPEDGDLRIDLKGDLAGILALASGSKKPASVRGDGHEQIKVVAGARNHRELTLPPVTV